MEKHTEHPAPKSGRSLKDQQLNVRVDAGLKQQFSARCDERGLSQAQIIESLMEMWLSHFGDAAARHLDGSECPVHAMVRTLTLAVEAELKVRGSR